MKTLLFTLLLFSGFAHAHPSDYFNITATHTFFFNWWVYDWNCSAGEVKTGDISRPTDEMGAIHFSETDLKNGIDCDVTFIHNHIQNYTFVLRIKKDHCKPGIPCSAFFKIHDEYPKGFKVSADHIRPDYDQGEPASLLLRRIHWRNR